MADENPIERGAAVQEEPARGINAKDAAATFYGWDSELRKAWRQRGAEKKEHNVGKLHAKAGAALSDAAVARWGNGEEKDIAQVTSGDLQAMGLAET